MLDSRGAGVPVVVHWGRDVGALTPTDLAALADAVVPAVPPSSIDVPLRLTLLPALGDGWTGIPGLSVSGARSAPQQLATTRDGDVVVVDQCGGGCRHHDPPRAHGAGRAARAPRSCATTVPSRSR